MVELVVSSLVVRVVSPERGGAGFRLAFEGEIAGAAALGRAPTVVVAITATHGSARAEARGPLGSIVQGRFRIESGLLGGAGEYAFQVRLHDVELYCGSVTVDAVGIGFAVAPQNLLDTATLWFDETGAADAPVLTCSFWCAADEALDAAPPGDRVADLRAALYLNGLPILHSDDPEPGRRSVRMRVVDVIDGPDAAHRFRRVQLRFPGARAFVLGEVPDVHDLSAHPGVYAIRVHAIRVHAIRDDDVRVNAMRVYAAPVTRGPETIVRVPFEIDWHGVLRESGPVESRADGTRVMVLGSGRRFGSPPVRGATTLDPVYARYFATLLGPQRVILDDLQCRALDRLVSDLVLTEGVLKLVDPEVGRAALHDLLTRVEEFETLLPADYPVVIDDERVPFERLRPYVLRQLAEFDGGADVIALHG